MLALDLGGVTAFNGCPATSGVSAIRLDADEPGVRTLLVAEES